MSSEQRSWLRSRSGWVLLGFLAIAEFFLWEEHKAHLLGVLPYGERRPAVTEEPAYELRSLVVINSLVFT